MRQSRFRRELDRGRNPRFLPPGLVLDPYLGHIQRPVDQRVPNRRRLGLIPPIPARSGLGLTTSALHTIVTEDLPRARWVIIDLLGGSETASVTLLPGGMAPLDHRCCVSGSVGFNRVRHPGFRRRFGQPADALPAWKTTDRRVRVDHARRPGPGKDQQSLAACRH